MAEWAVADKLAVVQWVALVGLSLMEAHTCAKDILEQQEPVPEVKAVVLANCSVSGKAMVEAAMRALRSRRADLEITRCTLRCAVKRQPWETSRQGAIDPTPQGHNLVVTWAHIPEDSTLQDTVFDDERDEEPQPLANLNHITCCWIKPGFSWRGRGGGGISTSASSEPNAQLGATLKDC